MVPTMFPPPKVFLCSDTDYLKLQHTIYIHVYICIPMNVSKYVYEQYDTEDDKVMHGSPTNTTFYLALPALRY